jgi:LPS export ABC transporter protein LptC
MISARISYIFLALALIVLLTACNGQQEGASTTGTSTAKTETEELPDQESWESSIIISKDGLRMAEVWAGYIANYNKRNEAVLKDSVHVDFYDQDGNHNSVLTSREGIVDNKTRNLTAIGNVVVVSDSGIVLETEELMWDNQEQKIVSNVSVKFTTLTDTLLGDSFISDPDLVNYEIRNARGYSQRRVQVGK